MRNKIIAEIGSVHDGSFDTILAIYESIKAGMHPYDGTVRPQFVDYETNPGFLI